MRWSVLLPTHNRPDTLALAIRSVLDQDDPDLELLVVGDGCTDETVEVVASFSDDRVLWFDLPKGPGFGYGNRRTAMQMARGEYVAFASHDDLWAPHHLSVLGRLLDDGAALAYSRPHWSVPSGHIVPMDFDLGDSAMAARFLVANYIPAPFVAVRKLSMDAAGGWPVDVEVAADWALWTRILDLPGASFGYSRRATALHFRSIRRQIDHFAVAAILAQKDVDQWWPPAAFVRPGELSQAAVVAAFGQDQRAWWDELEAASHLIVAHLAFFGIQEAARAVELERAYAAALASHEELDLGYRSSTSWRVTAPLRWLGSRLSRKRG